MRRMLLSCCFLLATVAHAQTSPVGVWRSVDDDGKRDTALIRVVDSAGVLAARIEKLLDPKDDPKGICDKCTDERKDKPVLGLTILRNVRKNKDEDNLWDGGDILDPQNGKVYKVLLRLAEGGKRLEVRGYIGVSLFGRTQVWHRVE